MEANESTQRSHHIIILIYEAKTQDTILSRAKRGWNSLNETTHGLARTHWTTVSLTEVWKSQPYYRRFHRFFLEFLLRRMIIRGAKNLKKCLI